MVQVAGMIIRKTKTAMYSALLSLVAHFVLVGLAHAQASLAAENIIDDVAINKNEIYTLFRDAREAQQWYYVPNQPRLFMRTTGATLQPEFSLLRYQFSDPTAPGEFIEQGIIQFAATLAAPPEAIGKFREAIQKRTGTSDVRISAMPFKAASVAIYDYGGPGQRGSLLAAVPYGNGIAPLFASQKMVFSVPLTKIGADVMNKLVSGQTGLPVTVDFSFNALTPPAGFKVTVNWDQTFKHYSSDEKFRVSASYFGFFGASYEKSAQELRESLINNKDIKVEVIAGENLKIEDIDKYLQPVLARINSELLKAEAPRNYAPEGWASLIRQHGPLWVTTNEGSGKNFAIHARVLSAIFGDGSLSGTTMIVVDPGDGKVHTESLGTFARRFEDVARIDLGDSGDLRPQVVHY